MLQDQPSISVIIPVYNAEKYLAECLDKTLGQSLHNIEILCIDDCSTDNSLKILNEYLNKDDRVKIYQMGKNSGSGPARNIGLLNSAGEYLAFMDPDDYYYNNDCLKNLYINAVKNNVNICGGNRKGLDNELNKLFTQPHLRTFRNNMFLSPIDFQGPYGYVQFIYKRSFIEKNNILFPAYRRFQDPVFFVKVIAACDKMFVLDKLIYIHRANHQKVIWNSGKASDVMNGINDILKILGQNCYWDGYRKAVFALLQIRFLVPCSILLDKKFIKSFCEVVKSVHLDKVSEEYHQEIIEALRSPRVFMIEPKLVLAFAPLLKLRNMFFPRFKFKNIIKRRNKNK